MTLPPQSPGVEEQRWPIVHFQEKTRELIANGNEKFHQIKISYMHIVFAVLCARSLCGKASSY